MPNVIEKLAKRLLFVLRVIRDVFCLVKNGCLYKLQKQSARVVLCLANPGSIGGTELQVQILAEYLKERGCCLVLLTGRVEKGRANGFLKELRERKISFLLLGRLCQISTEKWISWLFQFLAPQAEICHFFNPASTSLAPAAKGAGLRIFYMETGMPDRSEGWRILENTMRNFDCVTSVSLAGLDSLRRLYGYKGPGFVTASMIEPFPRVARAQTGQGFNLLYFGRLTPIKGVDRLIRAFARLLQNFPQARLSVIGWGESLYELQSLSESFSIADHVHFTGWVDRELLFIYLQKADLFCLPSETEGLPSSILEAMAIGLPVLATDVGGISEIVEDGISAFLVPPCNEELLYEALCQLAADPMLRARLAEAAFLRWQKREGRLSTLTALERAYGMSVDKLAQAF